MAIINHFGVEPGAAHETVHTMWARWRLEREHGTHDNQVIWGGPVPLLGDVSFANRGFLAMDRWLAAVEQDQSATPLPQKIISNRPVDVHDQCTGGNGTKTAENIDCVPPARRFDVGS